MKKFTVVIIAVVLQMLIRVIVVQAQSGELPRFKNEYLRDEDRVAAFVTSFIKKDFQASTLLNPSNVTLFAKGYRPKIGLPQDPETNNQKYSDLQKYFIKKIYLDLNSIQPFNQLSFQIFIDQVGRWSDQTLTCAGEISDKYGLSVAGPFIFETELAKIPDGFEKEEFKQCWLNDFVLGTELRIFAWIYEQLFNTPYVMPEKRRISYGTQPDIFRDTVLLVTPLTSGKAALTGIHIFVIQREMLRCLSFFLPLGAPWDKLRFKHSEI